MSCDAEIVPAPHSALDITDPLALKAFLKAKGAFSAILNAAAFMSVDRAEQNPQQSLKANGFALLPLAQLCLEQNILLVHFSTDQVFPGDEYISRP